MPLFFHDEVAVLRPGTRTNRAGKQEPAPIDPDDPDAPVRRVHVRPVSQDELDEADREASVSEWLVQTVPGTGDWDVLATDVLRVPDVGLCRIHGDAARPRDPFTGAIAHVQLRVRRVEAGWTP